MYRSKPHTTTGVSPAEMLFHRRLKTKLPQYFPVQDNETQMNAQKQNDANKLKQKLNLDEQHNIGDIGDKNLI